MSGPNTLKPPLHSSASPSDGEPADLDKLRKWQDQRLARRLKGEYESAIIRLSEAINSNLATPLEIASVRVQGAKNTRQSFLNFLIHPLLFAHASSEQKNLESVLHTTRGIGNLLQDSDIFKSVEVTIERTRDLLASGDAVDLIFKTQEKGRFYLNTSTEIGNDEGSANATGRIRNVFGGGETLEANIALGTKTRRSFRATFEAPLTSNLRTRGHLSIYGLERDNSSFASCTETLRGFKTAVRSGTPLYGMHELAYEVILRHIGNLTPTASISMRMCAGQSFKSGVSYTWLHDTRDDRITATQGHYTKLSQEFAGIGGDALFYKSEAEGQISRPIIPGVTLSLAARSGLLWGFGCPSFFPDRFQLGGPVSVRMFRASGLGPRDGSDSLGGDLYWSAGLSIISDIPRKPHWPVKTHLFVNAGRLDIMDRSRSLMSNVADALSKPSVSAGVGLIYRFDPVRVEVNFGVPLVASKSDGTRKGIQVGMGLEFL